MTVRDARVTALRGAVVQVAQDWRRSDMPGRVAIAVVGLLSAVLAGTFLFGAWHVLFGGLVKGNPRAAAFGVGLAVASGLALAGLALGWRRIAARR